MNIVRHSINKRASLKLRSNDTRLDLSYGNVKARTYDYIDRTLYDISDHDLICGPGWVVDTQEVFHAWSPLVEVNYG